MEYDSRLRVSHSSVATNKVTGGYLLKADFSYTADSRLQAKNDLLDDKFDRTNKYDFAGRLAFNQFGMGEASDFPGTYKRVYQQSIAYDGFSMMTSRSGVHWDNDIYFSESYTNGRITASHLQYDAAGNIIDNSVGSQNPHEFQRSSFDASGWRVEKQFCSN